MNKTKSQKKKQNRCNLPKKKSESNGIKISPDF